MKEIILEEVKEKLNNIKNKYLYIHIKGLINTSLIIDRANIIINNYRMIITDNQNQDLEIDITTVKCFISVAGNVFKFTIDNETEILIEIDKVHKEAINES